MLGGTRAAQPRHKLASCAVYGMHRWTHKEAFLTELVQTCAICGVAGLLGSLLGPPSDVLHHSPLSDQHVLALNHCPVVDAVAWKVAAPSYLLDLDNEMSQSVVNLLCTDVEIGEDEAVVAGAEVAGDVVVVGS